MSKRKKAKKGKNLAGLKARLEKFESVQSQGPTVANNPDLPAETKLKAKPTGQGFRSDKPTVRKFGEK